MLKSIVLIALFLIVIGVIVYGIVRHKKNKQTDETTPIIGDEWKCESCDSTNVESEQPISENLKNKQEYVNTKLDEIKDDAIKSNKNQTDVNGVKEEVKKTTPKPKSPKSTKKVDGESEPKKAEKKSTKKPNKK